VALATMVSRTDRLFLALVPDTAAAAQINRLASILKRAHGFGGKLIAQDRLHVSLFFLGGLSEGVIRAVCDAVAGVAAQSFEVTFDRTLSFRGKPGSRPFVLVGDDGATPLKSFRRSLAQAMTRRGLELLARTNFTPHVTLLYDPRSAEEYPIEPISWTAREFVLIHSLNGHVPLGRWPLRA